MFGWLKAATVRASRSKRVRRSGIGGHLLRQHLERDAAVQLGVLGDVHFAHSTLAEFLDEPVVQQVLPEFDGHLPVPPLRQCLPQPT